MPPDFSNLGHELALLSQAYYHVEEDWAHWEYGLQHHAEMVENLTEGWQQGASALLIDPASLPPSAEGILIPPGHRLVGAVDDPESGLQAYAVVDENGVLSFVFSGANRPSPGQEDHSALGIVANGELQLEDGSILPIEMSDAQFRAAQAFIDSTLDACTEAGVPLTTVHTVGHSFGGALADFTHVMLHDRFAQENSPYANVELTTTTIDSVGSRRLLESILPTYGYTFTTEGIGHLEENSLHIRANSDVRIPIQDGLANFNPHIDEPIGEIYIAEPIPGHSLFDFQPLIPPAAQKGLEKNASTLPTWLTDGIATTIEAIQQSISASPPMGGAEEEGIAFRPASTHIAR